MWLTCTIQYSCLMGQDYDWAVAVWSEDKKSISSYEVFLLHFHMVAIIQTRGEPAAKDFSPYNIQGVLAF